MDTAPCKVSTVWMKSEVEYRQLGSLQVTDYNCPCFCPLTSGSSFPGLSTSTHISSNSLENLQAFGARFIY